MKNMRAVRGAKSFVRDLSFDQDIFLALTLEYVVPRETLYTKAGKVKKIDVTNRIKAMLDGLSELIGVDDSRYFLGKCHFLIGTHKYVNITLEKVRIEAVKNGAKKSFKEKSKEKNDHKEN